jgi:hypothetical protein
MAALALAGVEWDVDAASARVVHAPGAGPISGHDGERLSVLCGALGTSLAAGEGTRAAEAAARLEAELAREAAAFRAAARTPGAELDLLRLAAVLTHNVGDVDQGISFWHRSPENAPYRARFGRLAHENTKPFGGAFAHAAAVYRETLATEGHRNYPLRGVRALRRSRDLLLPIAPFLDEWGALIARHPALDDADRGEVLAALVSGCQKIPGQTGYYRAIAGLEQARGLDAIAAHMPAALRRGLASSDVRRQVAVARVSFESALRKKSRALAGAR